MVFGDSVQHCAWSELHASGPRTASSMSVDIIDAQDSTRHISVENTRRDSLL